MSTPIDLPRWADIGLVPAVATVAAFLVAGLVVMSIGEMVLTPLQRSTGGKQRLGKTSKMGERTLRRLLIIGASAVVRWAARKGTPAGSWLERMLARKPRMLVAVSLANKMARIIWALLAKGGIYRASIAAA